MALDRVVDLLRFGRKLNFVDLADRARNARQWELAARLYRKALDRSPDNPPIWVQYGHALKESGELRDPGKLAHAEVAYRKALLLDPGAADTYLQLGHVLKLQGKTEEAQAAYLRAFALDPSMPYSLQELRGLGWSEAQVVELQGMIADRSIPESCGEGADQPRSKHFNAVTEAEICCLKTPSFSDEVALFVTHSPNGRLKPHVRHYINSLKHQSISAVLIVNTDASPEAAHVDFAVETDGVFVRQNEGYDFAAWAHILRLHPELFDAEILYLLNDSLIGPTNDTVFRDLLTRLRSSPADVIGLTENFDRAWHLQSYFLALKRRALSSVEFRKFINSIVSCRDLEDVVSQFELRFASILKAAGINCEALFPATDGRDPTVYHWKRLLQSGFPFVKVKVIRDVFAGVGASDCYQLLASQGYDVSLAERTLAESAVDAEATFGRTSPQSLPRKNDVRLQNYGVGQRFGLRRTRPSAVTLGDRARDAGQWELAAKLYGKGLDRDPRNPAIWVQYGHSLKESGELRDPGKLARAESAYRTALSLEPGAADPHLHLGHVLKLQGKTDEAEAFYLRALVLDPSMPYPLQELSGLGWPELRMAELRGLVSSDSAPPLAANLTSAEVAHLVERPLEPPEYGIKPPPVQPIASEAPGEVVMRSAMLMKIIPWRPRADLSDTVEKQYLSTKRRLATGEWLDELDAAMRSGSGSIGELNIDALCRGLGTIPLYELDRTRVETFPTPLLRRYREQQGKVGERFRLDHGRIGTVDAGPRISILMPVYGTPIVYLERAILSVICQTFAGWELCIVDNGSKSDNITAILDYYVAMDQRIRIARIPDNAGISAATNMALELATGSYIGLLDSDDMLTHDALEDVASRLISEPRIDLVYTDECKIDEHDIVDELMSKPDWSPLLLTSFMYTGHFSVYRTAIVRELGGFRSEFDFSQDYDLVLRAAECNPVVVHLRQYYYGWRMIGGSAAVGDKPHARQTNIAALQDAMNRRGWGGEAIALPTANRARRTLDKGPPLVSIIVPTDNSDHICQTIRSVVSSTRYRRYEIVVVTNSALISQWQEVNLSDWVRFLSYDKRFNFSDKCNSGAAAARGDYLIFFNDDVRVITPGWIDAILECVSLPGVGIVGPKLLYGDNRIQHAGMVTGTRRLVGTAFHTYPRHSPAHLNLAQSVREVSLISGACLAIEKALFDLVGGFDAVNVPREHSDVDLCLRVRELGYSCVYTPHAELTHLGHVSMGAEEAAGKTHQQNKHDIFILKRFGALLADDPYFPDAMRNILYVDSQEEFRLFPKRVASAPAQPTAYAPARALDILIFSHDLTESGAPRAAFDVARILRNDGHFVVVASPSDGPYRERLRNIGVDVIVDQLLLNQDHNVFDFARNFDKVICNTIVCWPVVAQLHKVVDVYWYVHESEIIHRHIRDAPEVLALLRSGVTLLVPSARPANALAEYGLKAQLIEYGVDNPDGWRWASRNDGERVVIGVFGSYESRKGQDLAVKGMLSLAPALRAHAELRLFGRTLDVSFRRDLERIAGGDGSIVFLGEVDHDECLKQMAATDVILVPSRDDPLPFVTLDALSLGKTLVCSNTTGTSAYLRDGISGLILHENIPVEIGRVLARAIADPGLRTALGEGAREVYERIFSARSFAEKLHSVLDLDRPAEIVG
jgi:GT2 family glycosyltransferase/glycosyltransferase involved in cell wall biosynthesis/tetratricopeptide (TPR) repeat protein